jgi:hypothetical protein
LSAVVWGSENYQVEAQIDEDGEIVSLACDCPFDQELICKHLVAVLLAIRAHLGDADNDDNDDYEFDYDESLEDLLQNLDKTELLRLLLEHVHEDEALERDLLFRYSNKASVKNKAAYARRLMQDSIAAASYRGFIDWRSTGQAVEGTYRAFELVDECNSQGDYRASVEICLTILEEMVELEGDCDDSDGEVSGTIEQALASLAKNTRRFIRHNPNDSSELFDTVFSHALSSRYDDWPDWRLEVLAACIPFCGSADARKRLDDYLAEWKERESAERWSGYTIERIEELQADVIRKADGNEAAEAFISTHLDNDAFREERYEKALEKGDNREVLDLSMGGVEVAVVNNHLGNIYKWRQREYESYERLGDKDNQRRIARVLATSDSRNSFEYFLEYKRLTPLNDWPQLLTELLGDLRKTGGVWSPYVKVLQHEGLKSELMTYCRANPLSIFSLYSDLVNDYRDEIDGLFVEHIEEMADRAGTRGGYQELCSRLEIYAQAIGRDSALGLRNRILLKYPRKPALRDELSKL